MPLYPIAIRVFVRLLLGLLLLSVGASKLARPGSFRRGLQDYQLLSSALDSRLSLSAILTYGLPIAEILAGIGLGWTNAASVFAATPNYIPCPTGCLLLSCDYSYQQQGNHCGNPNYPYYVTWQVQEPGREPNCVTNTYHACQSDCTNPCG